MGRAAHAQLSASAQLAEWAATLAVLGALALHRVSETAHSVAVAHRVWIAFGLAAHMAGLLVQLGVVASLATAMALTAGVRSRAPDANGRRRLWRAERRSAPRRPRSALDRAGLNEYRDGYAYAYLSLYSRTYEKREVAGRVP